MAAVLFKQSPSCIQCSSVIVADSLRGPERVFCDACKAERNRQRRRLCMARKRVAIGKPKRSEGMADHHVMLLDAVRRYVLNPKRLCVACGCAMLRVEPFGDRCSACASKRNQRVLRTARSARKALLRPDAFDPFEVFTASGWCCHYCGISTPRSLRGSKAPNAPEVDHLMPLSRGGEHSRVNVVCACKKCNSDKRAKTPVEFDAWRRA